MNTVILAGGGHSHLHCLLERSKEQTADRWILISPSRHQYYSGMFSGFVEGVYSEEEIRVDLEALCRKAHCEFVEASILSVDPIQQQLLTDAGELYSYDAASFDIGSRNEDPGTPGLAGANLRIKPNHRFPSQVERLYRSRDTVFIGGGAAACELALSLRAWKEKNGKPDDSITVIHSSPLLHEAGVLASRNMASLLDRRRICTVKGKAEQVTDGTVVTDQARHIPFDEVMFLGGAAAQGLFGSSLIPTDEKGFMLTNAHLQSISFPSLFAAGDCGTLADFPDFPKNGVTAVRQGPVLWENLNRFLTGRKLLAFQPRSRYLAILSTGNGNGFLLYGSFAVQGRWTRKLKKRLDRSFMKKYSSHEK
ncbi:FAD-dependent oxidoreductase [Rossellomorea sp. RS05]|uniref:FAD-dependent oxidoreductase n=1 Tax=Rossellomorea sp. RS05 TaxID=3149166 RepID=UPI0032214951